MEYQRTHSAVEPLKSIYDIEITGQYKSTWEYNHIVGFVPIIKDDNSIYLKLYLANISRYHWGSNTKWFMRDELLNGYHICLGNYGSNALVLERLDSMIDEIEKRIPHRYFVDKDVYNNTKNMIDFFSV